jgi:hypothetical protein
MDKLETDFIKIQTLIVIMDLYIHYNGTIQLRINFNQKDSE